MKNENAPSDPLRGLGRKKLRNLARKNKVKNAHLKSPAALRRAIRRAEKRTQEGHSPSLAKTKSREELLAERRKAELQAYQEHRLRYLYAPSQFAHTGTHEEFLLEKDDELNLPDFYNENQLRLLPVDPWQYYLYWDFAPETLESVKKHLAEESVFVLRSYDITSIAFDGSNAHGSWDAICHPLIREWYISSPVHDRHVCVELGVLNPLKGFLPLLRSNTTYIPPAGVSPVRRDLFAQFMPQAVDLPRPNQPAQRQPAAPPVTETPAVKSQVADAFFLPFVPTPHLLNPRPEPQHVLDYATVPRFIPQNIVPISQVAVPAPQAGRQEQLAELTPPPAPVLGSEADTDGPSYDNGYQETTWQQREARWSEALDAESAQNAGRESIRQSLGIPQGTEIRWFSELPSELTPMIFEQWITDPYDQAMFVSYSIWPWEMSEYLPLGASDWVQRKFLGASLFSWFRPAGSERMVRWQQFPGASEGARWLRPVGASERAWSGSNQPPGQREGSVWHLWPQRPLNYSGRGLFA
ncbi:MAG: DUF4912 domain-containing protein [Candidatus Sericytochromatia bacterium]